MDAESKRSLWKLIQSQHTELAAAFVEAKDKGFNTVRISGHPEATDAWIDQALNLHKPSIKKLITDELKPMIELFEDPEAAIEIEIADLVEALIANKGLGKSKGSRRRAAA